MIYSHFNEELPKKEVNLMRNKLENNLASQEDKPLGLHYKNQNRESNK